MTAEDVGGADQVTSRDDPPALALETRDAVIGLQAQLDELASRIAALESALEANGRRRSVRAFASQTWVFVRRRRP